MYQLLLESSAEHKNSVIKPKINKLKKEREAVRENVKEKVCELAREYMDQQKVLNELRGDQITEDARLLTCGIKLNANELERLFDRNAGNCTMQQIICRYAQEHDMGSEFRRAYCNPSSLCANLDIHLTNQVDVALKYTLALESFRR